MKRFALVASVAAVGLVVGSATAHAQAARDRASDDRAIRSLEQQFEDAWNRNDVNGMAAVFTNDADYINAAGKSAQGRPQIGRLFEQEMATQWRGTTFASTCGEIRYLSADVAEVDCRWVISGIQGQRGLTSSLQGLYTVVVKRSGGVWLVTAARAMVPLPETMTGARTRMNP